MQYMGLFSFYLWCKTTAILSSPLAVAIIKFMADKVEWSGTASELLKELYAIAHRENLDTQAKVWPRGANKISPRLKTIKSNLESMGIFYAIGRTMENLSCITIENKDCTWE